MWIRREQYKNLLKSIKSLEEQNQDLLANCYEKELQILELEEVISKTKVEKIPTKRKTTTRKTKKEE